MILQIPIFGNALYSKIKTQQFNYFIEYLNFIVAKTIFASRKNLRYHFLVSRSCYWQIVMNFAQSRHSLPHFFLLPYPPPPEFWVLKNSNPFACILFFIPHFPLLWKLINRKIFHQILGSNLFLIYKISFINSIKNSIRPILENERKFLETEGVKERVNMFLGFSLILINFHFFPTPGSRESPRNPFFWFLNGNFRIFYSFVK